VHAAPPLPVPPGLTSCRALVAYDPETAAALLALKNGGHRALVRPLAAAMARLVPAVDGLVVTWAPTSARRRRARGYDQAELLARALARRAGLRAGALLRRQAGPAQAGLGAGARWANPRFTARRCPWPVLVVDDVATTGATLSAAATALRTAGAPEVHGLIVARAPRSAVE
jgi:predicted amidophosphoribosyltransferase